jgi:hypothetical protein
MKKSYLFTGLILLAASPGFAQMKIGAAGAPDASAMLEVTSGTTGNKGLLLPKMTTAQRNAITSPATGLMIYNTTTNQVQVNAGTPLVPLWALATTTAAGWSITGNTGTTPASNFFGTIDNQPLAFRTNNIEGMRLTTAGWLGIGVDAPQTKLHLNSGSFRISNGSTLLTQPAIQVINDGAGGGNNDNIVIKSYGNAGQPSIGTFSSRGTLSAPANSQAGDNIGNFYFTARVNNVESNQNVITSQYLGDGTTIKSRMLISTSNTFAMSIDSSGYVGIGVVAPQQKLHVQGTARITGSTGTATTIAGRNAAGDLSNVAIGAGLNLTGGTLTATAGSNNWSLTGNTGSNPAANFIGTSDNQPLAIRTNNTEKMRVTAAGLVGIGTSTPVTALHIDSGAIRISNGTTVLTQPAIQVINDNAGSTYNDNIVIRSYGPAVRPSIGTFTARGTLTTPANSQAGDNIGNFYFNAQVNGGEANQTIISSDYLGTGTNSKSRLNIYTSNTLAMTIDSNTRVGIGVPSPLVKLHTNGSLLVRNDVNPSVGNGALFGWSTVRSGVGEAEFINYHGTGAGGFRFYDIDPGTSTATATSADWIAFIAPGTGDYAQKSDARVKTNINTISGGLEKVMAMRPVSYDLHTGTTPRNGIVSFASNDRTIKSIGFLAQELEKVVPEAVIVPKDPANELYSVSYATVIPLLTKAIQELNVKVDKLMSENEQLRANASSLAELTNRIKQLEKSVLANTATSGAQTTASK